MSNENVVGRSQCPKCLDSNQDNLITYSDGGQHCHACGYHKSGSGKFTVNTGEELMVNELKLAPFFESRNISEATLNKYSVKPFFNDELSKASVGFPLVDSSGNVTGYHFRELDVQAGELTRTFYYKKGTKVKIPLFGWQLVTSRTKKLFICEGETDALALATYYENQPEVVVVGAVGTGFAKKVGSWLLSRKPYAEIVLAFDNDRAGRAATQEVNAMLARQTEEYVEGGSKGGLVPMSANPACVAMSRGSYARDE